MSTKSVYHSGELKVQQLAGTLNMAAQIGRSIHSIMPPGVQEFLSEQHLLMAGSVDGSGRVWASLLTVTADFIRVIADDLVEIKPDAVPGDPLFENLQTNSLLGILVIDFATRSRIRLNGHAKLISDRIIFKIEQVYGNCRKYIQKRTIEIKPVSTVGQKVKANESLLPSQQEWITKADTFFVASYHPEGGADVSHRGGFPGFVKVTDGRTLIWPDYSGNKMFNTLGNIQANNKAGLLFIDFEQGNTLQLSGTAQIIWDESRIAEFTGAERLVEFTAEQVIEITSAHSLNSQFDGYSPFLLQQKQTVRDKPLTLK